MCGGVDQLENHHKDKNIDNWSEENKMTLCIACHSLIHKGCVVKKVVLDEIVSIEYVGEEMTYDIEMEHPYHNFVANGFVVHNSQRYCNYGKKGFQFIIPPTHREKPGQEERFINDALYAYGRYLEYINDGIPPEDAREILPNCTKTEVVTTGTLGYWINHIFPHRADNPKAQWQIRNIMQGVKGHMQGQLPEMFG
jgi:thymidylate synthase ThyX